MANSLARFGGETTLGRRQRHHEIQRKQGTQGAHGGGEVTSYEQDVSQ